MNRLRSFFKKRKVGTYKFMVFRNVFLLILVMLLAFFSYNIIDLMKEREENAQKEAQITANRVVTQIDERLDYLQLYYLNMGNSEAMNWILENPISYDHYSNYKAVYDSMNSKSIFASYISGFTFVNFKTNWVLSNKGMFQLSEAANGEELTMFLEELPLNKSCWKYIPYEQIAGNKTIARNDRITFELDGLNFVMRLPYDYYNTYAVFLANINMNTWQRWMSEFIEPYQKIMVVDEEEGLVYASSSQFSMQMLQDMKNDKVEIEHDTYQVASDRSKVTGWNYYVFSDVAYGASDIRYPYMVALIFLLAVASFLIVSYFIYHPIKKMMMNFDELNINEVEGNELEFVTGSYQNLKQNNIALESILDQQKDKLKELFEIRLIHGEVKDEEWQAYLESFQLSPKAYYATVVAILQVEEVVSNVVNEDAICLRILQEMPMQMKELAWMPPIYNASTIFAVFAEEDETILLQKIKEFHHAIQNCAQAVGGYQIQMGVSTTHTNYHHMRAAYRESINALTFHSLWQEEAQTQQADKTCHFYLSSSTVYTHQYDVHFEKDMQAAIKAVDKEQCYQVTDAFSTFMKEFQGTEEELLVYLLRFVNTILVTAVDAGISLHEIYPEGVKRIYRELLSVEEPNRERRYIKQYFIDPVIAYRTAYLEQHSHAILDEIEQEISQRKGNLTLTECAELLDVHPTYIWKVLKMERGKAFSDYVEEYKLQEAKRLLLETGLTVAEISEQLHYTNAQNFIRFFNKSTGMTPGKFRKLY